MRSEEEKTEDILYYEKKARAREYIEAFEKKLVRARIITAVCTAVLFAAAVGSLLSAYDSENTALVAVMALTIVVFAALIFTVSGAVMCRSLTAFFKWRMLRAKFRSAEELMNRVEEKFLDNTAFEPDVKKAESDLLESAEKILDFAEGQSK